MDRVAIFCDSSNIYHGIEGLFPGRRVDYGVLFAKVVGPDRRLMRAYWYTATPVTEPAASDKQRFLGYLQGVPYVEVRSKRLVPYQDQGVTRYREKGIDVWLAVDMVHMAHRDLYDVAALLSGDADLVPAVKGVKDVGKHVENFFVPGSQAYELRQQVDISVPMDTTWLAGLII